MKIMRCAEVDTYICSSSKNGSTTLHTNQPCGLGYATQFFKGNFNAENSTSNRKVNDKGRKEDTSKNSNSKFKIDMLFHSHIHVIASRFIRSGRHISNG